VVASAEEVGGAGVVAFVHTDHDAPDVVAALSHFLAADAGFVGVMGSRRHTGAHFEAMAGAGVPAERLERVRTPVGLDIGARGPAEIALSILAGVVASRHGRPGGWLG
ncbi:MAG TPA: XdhC family protein, partial [Acidimicrobiales bacterium]|nr:XdhC family protein [Acidimicrobiales bacterium]